MKLFRPPFILAHPADTQGCGYHRISRPLEILGRNGFTCARTELAYMNDVVLAAINPDVVVFQRPTEDQQLAAIKKYRSVLPNAHFVYEIDDAVSSVPELSPHRAHIAPNVNDRIREAALLCDVITVTTNPLAVHMATIVDGKIPVRVAPNMLAEDDLLICDRIRAEAKIPRDHRLRVGFGGGIGHVSDMGLLQKAFLELADEVLWIFLGINPELPAEAQKVFAGATAPNRYLASLAALDVDLIVAPLEQNHFNECKSNLRLLEAGACNYPVIASDVYPYKEHSPPVFSYAADADEWVSSIRAFAKLAPEHRELHGQRMRKWVERNFMFESHLAERTEAWLPADSITFVPRIDRNNTLTPSIDVIEVDLSQPDSVTKLKHAFEHGANDILYKRPDVIMSDTALERLRASGGDIVIGLSNDGGIWSFPNTNAFTPLDDFAAKKFDSIAAGIDAPKLIPCMAVAGPAIFVRRRAIAAIGVPDFTLPSAEHALLEWSANATARGLAVGVSPHVFTAAKALPPPQGSPEQVALRIQNRWPPGKSDAEALRRVREIIELRFHREVYTGLGPERHTEYPAWARLCDTRGPETVERALDWEKENGFANFDSIPYPAPVGTVTALPEDVNWIFFYPDTAEIAEDSYAFLSKAWLDAKAIEPVAIYADHDYLQAEQRLHPDFKPNFDLFMLLSRDYVTQALAVNRDVFVECYDGDEITSGGLYAMFLKIVDRYDREHVVHCPRVLAHLELPKGPLSDPEEQMKLIAAQDMLPALLNKTPNLTKHPTIGTHRNLSFALITENYIGKPPLVNIIIPTKDKVEMLAPCLETVLRMTTYTNFRVLIVNNGSTRKEHLDYLASITDPRVHVWDWPLEYNWAQLNNEAVEFLRSNTELGQFICFLNDDTRVMSPNWLSEMVGAALCDNVGAVGARLTYPHGAVQHVGVCADRGINGHIHKGLSVQDPGMHGYAMITHEATAVTGACMVVRTELFDIADRFNTDLAHNFNDVAFCLELYRRGFKNVVAINAELQHLEGVTRPVLTPEGRDHILREGKYLAEHYPEADPYWNPNLLISYVHNGFLVAGMDLKTFVIPAPPTPWGVPEQKRYLVVGPVDALKDELADNASIYIMQIDGYVARIVHPQMPNTGPWDIREPAKAREALRSLELDSVVLTMLGQQPLQTLQFIRRLDLPTVYRPLTAEAFCPRGDLKVNGKSCSRGYEHAGICQACLYSNGPTPQGTVNIAAWQADWSVFIDNVYELDQTKFIDKEFADGIGFVYLRNGARTRTVGSTLAGLNTNLATKLASPYEEVETIPRTVQEHLDGAAVPD